uniref:Uncharacterized protein n=1 Tax=Romanomermis culicivorax TaxID=13658 RepID=A0A915L4K2_ROMCU
MALQRILQCLTHTRAPNYPATEERKAIIREIYCEYQMEMDKRAKEKKRKDAMMLTKPAVPPKYQMTPALIISMTTAATTQPSVIGIQTLLGAAQRALAPRAPTTSQRLQMSPPGILKVSKTRTKVLPKVGRSVEVQKTQAVKEEDCRKNELNALIQSKRQLPMTSSNRLRRFTSKRGGVLWGELTYL